MQETDNQHNSSLAHARAAAAIDSFDAVIDTAQDDAVLDGVIALGDYQVVLFAFGLESRAEPKKNGRKMDGASWRP